MRERAHTHTREMVAGLQIAIQRLFPAAACCPTLPRPRPRARILANPARNPGRPKSAYTPTGLERRVMTPPGKSK